MPLIYNGIHGGSIDKASQSRFADYRHNFSNISSGRAVIIHYSLANFFQTRPLNKKVWHPACEGQRLTCGQSLRRDRSKSRLILLVSTC